MERAVLLLVVAGKKKMLITHICARTLNMSVRPFVLACTHFSYSNSPTLCPAKRTCNAVGGCKSQLAALERTLCILSDLPTSRLAVAARSIFRKLWEIRYITFSTLYRFSNKIANFNILKTSHISLVCMSLRNLIIIIADISLVSYYF